MTSRPRYPIGLTFAAGIVFAACAGLGFWQLQRGAWKTHELARIAALGGAPAQPIWPVLEKAAGGADISFTRVVVICAQGSAPAGYRMAAEGGEWIARPLGLCRVTPPPRGALAMARWVTVDRGILATSRGKTEAPTTVLPPPLRVEGIFRPGPTSARGPRGPILVAEREDPPPPGVVPDPATQRAPDNLQYVGAYWLTWFGLAGAVAGVYAAMLWRRYHPKPNPPPKPVLPQ